MEIIGVNTATKYSPTIIKFTWNNGKRGYVGIRHGEMSFFNLVFNEEYQTWQYVLSDYKPNENIIKAVANLVLKYSRALIQEKIKEYDKKYQDYCKMRTDYDRFAHDRIAARYKMLNYQESLQQIELFEKFWRGRNEKVC